MTAPTPITLAESVRARLEDYQAGLSDRGVLREGEIIPLDDPRVELDDDGDPVLERGDVQIYGTDGLRIYGALDLSLASARLPLLAAVGLGEDTDRDLAPEGTATVQRVLSTVGVIAAVPARNDPHGDKARDPLDDLLRDARALLVGWTPARRWDPLGLRRSRLLDLAAGRAWWQDEYITSGWRGAGRG